jgi:CHAT domain-containing protein
LPSNLTLLKKFLPLLFLLVIIPAKAIPIYSYDEGIERLNTAPLTEIDRLAEEFAMGEFDVNKGNNRQEFYKLLSEKIALIPSFKAMYTSPGAENIKLNTVVIANIVVAEQLTTLYATRSLLLDPPEVFKSKYPKFINSWLFVRRTMIPNGSLGLFEFGLFQTVSTALNKEALTSQLFIETVMRFKENSSVNNGQIWDGLMDAVFLTNLRSIDLVDHRIPKMQEELIRDYLIQNVALLKKDPKRQYEYLMNRLTPIIRGKYQFSFDGLDNWFEIIWAQKNEPNIEGQIQLLMDFYRSRANWELKITPNEYLNKTLKLVNGCNTPACKNAKSVVIASLVQIKRNLGKYDEAEKLAKLSADLNASRFEKAPKSPLLILSNQFAIQQMQGKYAEADKILREIREFIKEPNNFPGATPETYHLLVITYGVSGIEFDIQMGKYQQAKEYTELYLKYVQDYADRSFYQKYNFLEIKTRLISLLGKAEIGLGNSEKGRQLVDYARDYEGGGNNLSYLDLETKFWDAFWDKDFDSAYRYINRAYANYLSSKELGTAIPLDILDSVMRDEIALAKENLGRVEIDPISFKKFLASSAINFEALYYSNSVLVPSILLGNLALSWKNYSLFMGDNKYASFYAKRYVNMLQELRSNIRMGDSGALSSFTGIYKDNLQAMSNTFFAVNDFDSASKTLSIIKENELLDFSTSDLRSGIIETYISYTKEEQKFFVKIKPIQKELARLQELSVDAIKRNRIDEVKKISVIYNANIKQIQNALIALRKGVDIAPAVVKFEPINKDKGFAIVQAMITQDRAIFNISADGINEQVAIPIARDKLRLMIYQAYSALSAPGQDWKTGVDALDAQVFSPLNAKIKSLGIKNVYFVPDDAITFLPPDFIFNNQGSHVVTINLVSAKSMPVKKGSARTGVDAFAATKGSGSFPPLPSARDEATFLSSYKFTKLNPDSVQRAFIDSNFTKLNLKESLSSPRDIVHIASHFKASGGTDKDVGLLLGDGSFLSLQDLFAGGQSYSGVSLLTLSACETGVSLANLSSQAKTFDGLAGLFAKKGVSQVLATLWKISDASTADFMKVFYIYKESEGLTSVAALEMTKTLFSGKNTQEIQILSNKYPDIFTPAFNSKLIKYSHPFHWAGFVLVSSGT